MENGPDVTCNLTIENVHRGHGATKDNANVIWAVNHRSVARAVLRLVARGGFVLALGYSLTATSIAQTVGKLTSEQEEYFPKNAPIDAEEWSKWTQSSKSAVDQEMFKKQPGTRFHTEFNLSPPNFVSKVCKSWQANQELWGGALIGGCYSLQLHPSLPDRDAFKLIDWHEIDARQHIDVIRASFLAGHDDPKAGSANENPYWRKVGPVFKRLLEEGKIRMDEAMFDANNSGKPQHLYAITSLPAFGCLKQDGSNDFDRGILFMDAKESGAASFNSLHLGGTMFAFENHTYLPVIWGLDDISESTSARGETKSVVTTQCEIN